MPGKPTERLTRDQDIPQPIAVMSFKAGETAFIAMRIPHREPVPRSEAETVFRGIKQSAAQGKLRAGRSRLTVGGFPAALETTTESAGDSRSGPHLHGRFILEGNARHVSSLGDLTQGRCAGGDRALPQLAANQPDGEQRRARTGRGGRGAHQAPGGRMADRGASRGGVLRDDAREARGTAARERRSGARPQTDVQGAHADRTGRCRCPVCRPGRARTSRTVMTRCSSTPSRRRHPKRPRRAKSKLVHDRKLIISGPPGSGIQPGVRRREGRHEASRAFDPRRQAGLSARRHAARRDFPSVPAAARLSFSSFRLSRDATPSTRADQEPPGPGSISPSTKGTQQ